MAELKTLLMVVHDFPPLRSSGIYRPVKFAKYLLEFGWKVHVLTVTEPIEGPLDRAMLSELPAVTKISRAESSGLKEMEQQFFNRFFRRRVNTPSTATAYGRRSSDAPSVEVRGPQKQQEQEEAGTEKKFNLMILLKEIARRMILSPVSRFTHTHVYVPDIRIGWKKAAIAAGVEIFRTEKIDAIYSTSAPETSHLVAQSLHRRSGIPWVVEFRDPWYHNFTRDHYPASRLRRELRMQRKVMQDATAIVYSASRMRGHNKLTFPELPDEKQFVINNGYDEANFQVVTNHYQADSNAPLRIVHVGTVYAHSTFVNFLDGMERYYQQQSASGESRARLVFIGEPGEFWHPRLNRPPFEGNVEFLGFKPHEEAVKLMREADLLLLTIPKDGSRFSTDYNIPGKVFELIRAERPVLMIGKAGDTADILLECKGGELVSPDDPHQIASAVARFAEQKRKGDLSSQANLSVLRKYERRTQTEQLARILDQITASSGREFTKKAS